MMRRRQIDLRTAEDVVREVELIRANGYERTGKWNLTQICQHLDATITGGMDGFGFRLPRILRATVIKWSFNHYLKTRKLSSGFPTFNSLKPSHSDSVDDDAVIDRLIDTCRRADAFEGPMDDYALLDNLAVDDWKQFMWIHAGHHLGFLIPNAAKVTVKASA